MAEVSAILSNQNAHGGRESNRLRAEDHCVHDWYRFVLSFPPHLVRDYLDRFRMGSGCTVLDPFCGTGTTLVECKKLGIMSIGIEANPMPCFASRVKTDWGVCADDLLSHAEEVAQVAIERLEADGLPEYGDLPLFDSSALRGGPKLRTLPEATEKLLLTNSISPLPLHRTLVLLEVLQELKDERFSRYERLGLAKALVFTIGNLEFGPEVGVGTPKVDVPVVTVWLRAIHAMAEDLRAVRSLNWTNATVHAADARQAFRVLGPASVDAVITSPPYPNEKDYTRTTRLESVLLGFIKSKQDLRSLKQDLVRSNTRGVYKSDRDDLLVADHNAIQDIAEAIEQRRIALGKTSGFERLYAKVTKLYFG